MVFGPQRIARWLIVIYLKDAIARGYSLLMVGNADGNVIYLWKRFLLDVWRALINYIRFHLNTLILIEIIFCRINKIKQI